MIEAISEKAATYDRTTKLALYGQAGVPEYWIIDHRLSRFERRNLAASGRYPLPHMFGPGDTIDSLALEGLSVAVDDVFAAVIVW